MSSKNFSFIFLDGQKIEIPLTIKQLSHFPETISDQLFVKGEYFIQSNVQEAVFKGFIDHFLDSNKNLEINENNIIQIQLLNNEFEISIDLQTVPEYAKAFDLSILSQVSSKEIPDKPTYERYISQRLDDFLKKYPNEMYTVPINSLYNIFNHRDRKLNNQDMAYKFITNALIPEGNVNFNNNFFILLESLDSSKLSNEIIDDCISKQNDHFLYMPQNILSIQKDKAKNREMTPDIVSKSHAASIEFEKILNQIRAGQLNVATIPANLYVIHEYCFKDCPILVEVVIPSSVIYIGSNAFYRCSSLKKVVIPSSVEAIDSYAFTECSSLAQITIPSSVKYIGDYSFYSCSSLTQLAIPSSVNYIGNGLFNECTKLEKVTIPSSAIMICSYFFYKCHSLSEITIPSSVAAIGREAFSECSKLTKIVVPASVSSIGYGCFRYSKSLVEVDISKTSISGLGIYMFSNCENLKKVCLPSSLTCICEKSFEQCSSLNEIEIPSSVVKIENNAFYSCKSLTHITIPKSVNSIGSNVFCQCPSLIEIEILSNNITFATGGSLLDKIYAQMKIPSSVSIPPNIIPSTVNIIRT